MAWCAGMVLTAIVAAGGGTEPLASLNQATGLKFTFDQKGATAVVSTAAADTTDGDGGLVLTATTQTGAGNHYHGVVIPLGRPVDLRDKRLLLDVRTNDPGTTAAFYFRGFNQGQSKPAISFSSWNRQLKQAWRTISFQPGLAADGWQWEADVVGDQVPDKIDRLELIIGSAEPQVKVSLVADNLRTAPRLRTVAQLAAARPLVRDTVLAQGGRPAATVLHPDSASGQAAAAKVVAAIKAQTGVELPARPATEADREPSGTVILLGNVDSNPALLLLYARLLTPVDSVCPGRGGALVHTVFDPFGKGANAVILGAADEAGLTKAVDLFAVEVGKLPKTGDVALPRLFVRAYGADFLERYRWANENPAAKQLDDGLKEGQRALDEGQHTSIAGVLERVALRYQLTGAAIEAKLFVRLWEMYAKSAVADPRKYGGPWGFDSDFPSYQVVSGWDVIEHDPGLTDADRLAVTRALARWLAEAVVPKASSNPDHVPHNHATFPGLGCLRAGLYFTQAYDALEGQQWLAQADRLFQGQLRNFKPMEDCNGYQWLTNGHLFRYSLARPNFEVFRNGNGRKIIDYCLGTMDNLGIQVPYGDTGSWKCWNSEMICLDMFAFATGDAGATWAAQRKREFKKTKELYSFYRSAPGEKPTTFDGVRVFDLDARYYATFPEEGAPPLERCVDKVAFREALEPDAPYLLLDGLSNGGHKHLDGNSIPRITQFGRVWLADNDYFKAQTKYHNSLVLFKDGQATPIPGYCELLGAGETPRYGFSRTRVANYSGADWDRTIVWLKQQKAYVVLDRVQARTADEYQLRLLWHGVGAAKFDPARGMFLAQKGPGMWIQTAPGPKLRLYDDADLGSNWDDYPYAEPVIHSLTAAAQVRLKQGESYLFATVLHGTPTGDGQPWGLSWIQGQDAVKVETETGSLVVAAGPLLVGTPVGEFRSDCQSVILDSAGVSFLGGTNAEVAGMVLHQSDKPSSADFPAAEAAAMLEQVPSRPPVPNLTIAANAPAHKELWSKQPQPEMLVVSGNRNLPGAVNLGAKLTATPAPSTPNVFDPTAPNTLAALLDGKDQTTGGSVMYPPDQTVTLTLDLGKVVELGRVSWQQWWSTTSSRKTSYLLRKATVSASNDNFAADQHLLGTVTDAGPHPNFGAPVKYSVDAKGEAARYLRWVIEPQPGSAVYLAELLAEGRLPEGSAVVAPYHFTRVVTGKLTGGPAQLVAATAEGTLLALRPDGQPLWSKTFPGALNDVVCADVDGDGKDEVVVARQDHFVTLLSADGQERWSRELKFYRRPPSVNLVRVGDLDGDGRPEVIAGGENWRFYAYKADGTELWNYESVHPSRSGQVADLDGNGKGEVLCGTHYYWFSCLNPDGTQRWGYHCGPICYDVATGHFDGDKTRGVLLGGGDGILHYLDRNGKVRMTYNTGDEVRRVAAADLDGDGKDEILAASLNDNLYCFGGDTKRRWRVDLGAPVSALRTAARGQGATVVCGTTAGQLITLDAAGQVTGLTQLGAAVVDVVIDGQTAVVATADGKLRRFAL